MSDDIAEMFARLQAEREYAPAGYRGDSYVTGATQACIHRGCQGPDLMRLAESGANQVRAMIDQMTRKEERVSVQATQALWCEQGGHSFSEKDPGVQVITIAGKGAAGEPAEESRTCCGQCAAETNTRIGAARHTQAPALGHHGSHDEQRPAF